MNHQNQIGYRRSPYLFFFRFILMFLILYFFFFFYWGLTGVGGRIYSDFLAHHANLIKGFSHLLTKIASVLLNTFGYETIMRDSNTLRIGSSRGVAVNPSCLGWGVISFWLAFVYANEGNVIHKTKWMLAGFLTITGINTIRIALIVLANHLNWGVITHLDHHQTFNIASYGCVFVLMFFYVKVQKKYEQKTFCSPSIGNNYND